jgi:hypothetical protein
MTVCSDMRPSSVLSVKSPGRRGLRAMFNPHRSKVIEMKGEGVRNECGRQDGERQGVLLFRRSTCVPHSSHLQNILGNVKAFALSLEYR